MLCRQSIGQTPGGVGRQPSAPWADGPLIRRLQAYRIAVDEAWARLTGGAGSGTAAPTAAAAGAAAVAPSPLPGLDAAGLAPKGQRQPAPAGAAGAGGAGLGGAEPPGARGTREQLLADLRQVFARGQDEQFDGLTPGFLEGPRHQRLVRGRAPRHRGACLGRVRAITRRGGVVVGPLLAAVKPGDGVVFDQGRPEETEEGGSVYEIYGTPTHSGGGGGSRADTQARGGRARFSGGGGGGRRLEAAAAGATVELLFGEGQVDGRWLQVSPPGGVSAACQGVAARGRRAPVPFGPPRSLPLPGAGV
jgi:hypothetical protein